MCFANLWYKLIDPSVGWVIQLAGKDYIYNVIIHIRDLVYLQQQKEVSNETDYIIIVYAHEMTEWLFPEVHKEEFVGIRVC